MYLLPRGTLHTEKLFIKKSISKVLISFAVFIEIALLSQLLKVVYENTCTLQSFALH